MKCRYLIEITDGPTPYYHFVYFDTEDHLARFLFARDSVEVTVEGEYGNEEEPYRFIACRIPLSQREAFLQVIDELPEWMKYLGKTDYDEFCRNVLEDMAAFQASGRMAGDSRLQ